MSVLIKSILQLTGNAELCACKGSPQILQLLEDANNNYRQAAAKRLEALLGVNIVNACKKMELSQKCEFVRNTVAHNMIDLNPQKLTQFLSNGIHLVAEPGGKISSSVVEMRTPNYAISGASFGARIEPEESLYIIDSDCVWSEIESGATLTIRYIDLFFPELSFISDELMAITGSNTFAKLFVTAGTKSTSGRHFDSSDVIIIILKGKKHFRIEPPEGIEARGFDKVLALGDVLFLPSPWPHLVTPIGETCIHVTIGIKQNELWKKSKVLPTHLGYSTTYNDSVLMGLILPKLPPSFSLPVTDEARVRSAAPGGFIPIGEEDGVISILGAGRIVNMGKLDLMVLAAVHSSSVIEVTELSQSLKISMQDLIPILEELKRARLIGIDQHYIRYSNFTCETE